MKRIGMISTAVLSLALGVAAPAFAQQEQHDQQDEQKAKSGQEEKKAQPEKSAKPEEKNAQQQEKNNKSAEKPAERQQQQQHAQQAQPGKQEQRAGGNGGGRIPDDRFRANFGEQHRFRVSQADYSRDHRFQYGGYWFGIMNPWPSNWLYTQDVYVIEINGVYYLCNPMYPGVNILLSVTP